MTMWDFADNHPWVYLLALIVIAESAESVIKSVAKAVRRR